jgi:hypothetical protein
MRFDVYDDTAGHFRWRLWSGSNKVAASGESFASKAHTLYLFCDSRRPDSGPSAERSSSARPLRQHGRLRRGNSSLAFCGCPARGYAVDAR